MSADTPPTGEPAPHAAVQVRLLDGFELTVDERPYGLPPSAQRLVAFLALQPRPVMRSHTAGVLWADRSEARAAACLRSAIWRSNAGCEQPIVDAGRSRVRLHASVSVDARIAAQVAHDQITGGHDAVSPAVLAGELLPGWYDDWVIVERERMRQLCLQAMERMAESLLAAGQVHLAIEAAITVVSAEPLRESAHRVLVDAYVSAGNRGEALRQYERCCAILGKELGLPPGEAMIAAAARAHGPAAVTSAARLVLKQSSATAVAGSR